MNSEDIDFDPAFLVSLRKDFEAKIEAVINDIEKNLLARGFNASTTHSILGVLLAEYCACYALVITRGSAETSLKVFAEAVASRKPIVDQAIALAKKKGPES